MPRVDEAVGAAVCRVAAAEEIMDAVRSWGCWNSAISSLVARRVGGLREEVDRIQVEPEVAVHDVVETGLLSAFVCRAHPSGRAQQEVRAGPRLDRFRNDLFDPRDIEDTP
ncbi:hypothetical protein [Streptomyces sp. NPDC059176]|uniref:hypothetical protein n=1 Tax=unclassified Streptomyces TaxID=2593676 RepID=UPI003682C081